MSDTDRLEYTDLGILDPNHAYGIKCKEHPEAGVRATARLILCPVCKYTLARKVA